MPADEATSPPPTVEALPTPARDHEQLNQQNRKQPETAPAHKVPRKRFVGRRRAESSHQNDPQATGDVENSITTTPQARRPGRTLNSIPSSILNDPALNEAITTLLPSNYNFELHKTIHTIRSTSSRRVALQLPEGLLLFACTISDIIETFCAGVETVIMGDVTYGACCIDDFTARALECDLLIHYAHSCLVPVDVTKIKTLYVFVTIGVDVAHLIATIKRNFDPARGKLAFVGTIQFNPTIHALRAPLEAAGYSILIPQIMPLSKGEVLGCTSPLLPTHNQDEKVQALIYVGDGRFHLESAMIQNPTTPAYRYDPYSKKISSESYNHTEMLQLRADAISTASRAKKWGLILGTLGRQGNLNTLEAIESLLEAHGKTWVKLALSEIFPGKLALMSGTEKGEQDEGIGAWVQVACPRLSIDWGYAFPRPLLSPYEAMVALGGREGWEKEGRYPMDFYAREGLGRTGR